MFIYSRTTVDRRTGVCTEKYWSEPEHGDAYEFIQGVVKATDMVGGVTQVVVSNGAAMILKPLESTLIYAENIP